MVDKHHFLTPDTPVIDILEIPSRLLQDSDGTGSIPSPSSVLKSKTNSSKTSSRNKPKSCLNANSEVMVDVEKEDECLSTDRGVNVCGTGSNGVENKRKRKSAKELDCQLKKSMKMYQLRPQKSLERQKRDEKDSIGKVLNKGGTPRKLCSSCL